MSFERLTASADDSLVLGGFWPPLADWWRSNFQGMSLPQRLAVPAIAAGKHVLVCAPTGTGKTFCAFIVILSDLLKRASENSLGDEIDTVYISPLRALGTDIRRNLLVPLEQIATATGTMPIRVGLRTGDTPARERAAMIRKPPHILVTTPESLALCLASTAMRDRLARVRRIIIDELHSLAPNKRGVDLMLSVERLTDFVASQGGGEPQRIGLSATIAPLERMARYLIGADASRTCAIADASFDRPLDLQIASVFGKTPFLTTAAINRGVYDHLEKTIRAHRTTLVFTNVRSATERVCFALRKRFAAALDAGENNSDAMIHPAQIEAHHSSLDRDIRHEVERRLKAGELRCVVCSTSLELGIDIGTVDHVVLLNSPKGVARGLQRIGRSGHRLDGTSRGTLLPTVPADLLEAMVTADAMRKRSLHEISCPANCLDVLAQHLIGMALQARPHGIRLDHAYALIRRTACYADLPWESFLDVVRYVATCDLHESARLEAKLLLEPPERDASVEHAVLQPLRKSLGGLYAQNVGTITQEGQVKVRVQGGAVVGAIEEAFAQILKINDRFVLGGRCLQLAASRGMSVEVVECAGQMPTVPRWFSGAMSMETGLAARMREFRAKVRAIAPAGQAAIARMLCRQYAADEPLAHVAAAYLHAQHRYAEIPAEGQLLVERIPDERGALGPATVLVFHTMIGRAANEALARVVAYRMHQRWSVPSRDRKGATALASRNSRGQTTVGGAAVVVDDYAFGVWVEASSAARRADRTLIRSLLSPAGFEDDLIAAVESSDLFRAQFRFTAIRAHALLQQKFGRRRFIGQLQGYATRLYDALREHHPDHLLISETRRTVMQDVLNAPAAKDFLQNLPAQGLQLMDLPSPSPFAFGLFATGKRDTLQLADTADFLLAMYEQVQRRLAAEAPPQKELFS